jgi:hypothetical protein
MSKKERQDGPGTVSSSKAQQLIEAQEAREAEMSGRGQETVVNSQVVQEAFPKSEVVPGTTPASGIVQVPSKGLLYGNKLPDGLVEVAALTAREEKLIAGAVGDVHEMIDALLGRCMLTKTISPQEMLLSDRLFILFNIRANSYGPKYGWETTCRSCRQPFRHTMDIPGDVEVAWLTDESEEPFEVALPISGHKVGFRLLRGFDEQKVVKYVQLQARRGKVGGGWGDPAYSYRVALQIMEITPGGLDREKIEALADELYDAGEISAPEVDECLELFPERVLECWGQTGDAQTFSPDSRVGLEKRIEFVETLVGKDSFELRDAIERNEPGLMLSVDLTCPNCQAILRNEVVPMSAEFFRPSRRTRRGH